MHEKSIRLRRQREEYEKFSKSAGLLTQNERNQVVGFGRSISGKVTATYNQLLTWGNGNATIGLKAYYFKKDVANGNVNLNVDMKNQPKHLLNKGWKNQVKQAVKSGGKITPKSLLAKGLDPQDLINKYAGTGDEYNFRPNQKYPDEFISLPFVVGRTYDNSTGKYIETRRLQIKYNEKSGAHIFPVKEI